MGAIFKDKKLLLGCLKGEPGPAGPAGMKLEKMEFVGQDANGGNIYEMTFSDGTKVQFVAPKGESAGGGSAEADGVTIVEGENGLQLAQKYIDFLDSQLYEAPTISTFALSGVKTIYEVGEEIAATGFTHEETNRANISGNLSLYIDGAENKSVTPSSTLATVGIEHSVKKNTPASVEFKLEGKDTKGNTFSKRANVPVAAPFYIGGNASESVTASDIVGLTKQELKTNIAGTYGVTLESDGYIYFCCYSGQSIKAVVSGPLSVPLESPETVTDVGINGASLSYKVYRTSNKIVAGTYSYDIS